MSNPDAFAIDSITPGAWDGVHVWAPSIVRAGPTTFHMFYTGVNSANDQTIGYATASSIDTIDAPGHWTRRTTATLTPSNATDWVKQTHPWAFRDPFVMADPENPARYLLFYTAATAADTAHNAVGIFQSFSGNLDSWTNGGHYVVTEYDSNGVGGLESPHVFADSSHHDPSQSAAATWRLMYTNGPWSDWRRAVLFNTKVIGRSLTDTWADSWQQPVVGLGDYLGLGLADTTAPEYGVQASEILQIGGTYYWGGYNGEELVFRKLRWGLPTSTDFALVDVNFLAVAERELPRATGLRLAELGFGSGRVRFRVELPSPMQANVTLYDVMGRVVRPLADRHFPAGATELPWDGLDRSGVAVSSGIYFARLRAGDACHVVRVPFVR